MYSKKILLLLLSIIIFFSCKEKNIIVEFTPMLQYANQDTVNMDMDLTGTVFEGIYLPSKKQKDSLFSFSAKIKLEENKKYFYKIYYQNESYKFDEKNEYASENFYGSWENTDIEFKPVPLSGNIKDSFRIVGNPRNEKKYFGESFDKIYTEKDILDCIEGIKRDSSWYSSIVVKAKDAKREVSEQLYLDAMWIMEHNRHKEGDSNNRWKRNPRTGCYSFMLVVVTEEALKQIPKEVKNISIEDSLRGFMNPYYYFKHGKGRNKKGVSTTISKQVLKTRAILNGERGVYIDRSAYPSSQFRVFPENYNCNDSDSLYKKALFSQYFHNISKDYSLNNIPVIADILNDNYTINDYSNNAKKFSDVKTRIKGHPYITDYPGKTIKIGDNGKYISLINSGNPKGTLKPKKESVGIMSRVGFTYGKYRGKIKFPAQLNKTGVWSGLTNAFWLIYQSNYDWNNRRVCKKEGYVKSDGQSSATLEKVPVTQYSEIDIEIIKTSKFWPGEKVDKNYNPFGSQEAILACTNWDLACPTPKRYMGAGLHNFKYKNNTFTYQRWFDTYRALTIRTPIDNKIFDDEFYYYEIEWRPNEIIWRIGKSPNSMYVVGYMNENSTVIPNNQMISVVTQEYHYTEFWPPTIFDQNLLPYPEKDIEGKVYEIIIE